MNASAMSNRHPVDQLAIVRQDIKELQARESELKDQIGKLMGTADSLGGDEWIARQSIQERKGGIDEAKLKAAGIDADAFRKPATTAIVLRVERRAELEAA
jgi:uncharacterized protein (UPF0335 family)